MATACIVISLAACVAFIGIVVVAAIVDLRMLRIPNGLIIAACAIWLVEHAALLVLSGALAAALAVFSDEGFSATALIRVLGGIAAFSSGFGSHAPTIGNALAGALLLGGGTLLLSLAYETIARKPSIGGGDIKLLFVAGLYLGWWRCLFCVIIACIAFLALSAALPRIGWRPEEGWAQEEGRCERASCPEGSSCSEECAYFEGCLHVEGCLPAAALSSAKKCSSAEEPPSANASTTFEEAAYGFPFAPAIALGALIALVLP